MDEDEDAGVEGRLADDIWCSLNKMASGLCSTCHEFPRGQFESTGDKSDYHIYYPSMSSLHKSVNAGCCICKDLSQRLEVCKRFWPATTLTEQWSIRCELSSHDFWRRNVGLCYYAFCLEFYVGEGEYKSALRKFFDETPFESMQFFPADCLGLGPEFLGK